MQINVIENHDKESLLIRYVDDHVTQADREHAEKLIRNDKAAADFAQQLEQTRDAFVQPLPTTNNDTVEMIKQWQPAASDSQQKRFGVKAICATLLAGLIAGHLLTAVTDLGSNLYKQTGLQVTDETTPEWVRLVADYHLLYVQETIADAQVLPMELAKSNVSSWLERDTNIPVLAEQGIHFKRAQQLSVEDNVLIQLAYLPENKKPVAICIRKTTHNTNTDISYSNHGEMDYALWQDGQHAVVIVGRLNQPELKLIAKKVRRTLFDA